MKPTAVVPIVLLLTVFLNGCCSDCCGPGEADGEQPSYLLAPGYYMPYQTEDKVTIRVQQDSLDTSFVLVKTHDTISSIESFDDCMPSDFRYQERMIRFASVGEDAQLNCKIEGTSQDLIWVGLTVNGEFVTEEHVKVYPDVNFYDEVVPFGRSGQDQNRVVLDERMRFKSIARKRFDHFTTTDTLYTEYTFSYE